MEESKAYKTRISRLQNRLKNRKADALFVTNPSNVFYLTGFRGISPYERESSVLVTRESCYLYLPCMYAEEGRKTVSVIHNDVVCVVDEEREGILTLFVNDVSSKAMVMIEEYNLSTAEYHYLKQVFKGSLIMGRGEIEAMRAIKDEIEVSYIRQAVSITDAVYNHLTSFLQNEGYSDLTEQQLVYRLQEWYLQEGGEGFGFNPIVAVGASSSQPHYRSGHAKLESGHPLLLDVGITKYGYTGDLTRTLYLGSAPQQFKDNYSVVRDCNQVCIASVKPGIDISELQAKAVTYFEKRGLANHFIHSLGHGVGLNIHEEPFIRSSRELLLSPGMTLTIEPGIYFNNSYGIRIEDYCLVTEEGCEVLSSSTKELLEIA